MKNFTVTVKKKFLDRYTGTFRKPGEKLTISEARFNEIKRSGDYVEIEKAVAASPSKEEKPLADLKK